MNCRYAARFHVSLAGMIDCYDARYRLTSARERYS